MSLHLKGLRRLARPFFVGVVLAFRRGGITWRRIMEAKSGREVSPVASLTTAALFRMVWIMRRKYPNGRFLFCGNAWPVLWCYDAERPDRPFPGDEKGAKTAHTY